MAKYYHVSRNLMHDGTFTTTIPYNRADWENEDIPRICVSKTLEGCFTAIPGGGLGLEETCDEDNLFLVFEFDTEKLGISDEDIVDSDYLYQEDLVRDADMTDECWILKDVGVATEDSYIIRLNTWDESVSDLIPYKLYDIADEKYEGDYISAYMNVYEKNVPCITVISNLKCDFIHDKTEMDSLIEFPLEIDVPRMKEVSNGYIYDTFR